MDNPSVKYGLTGAVVIILIDLFLALFSTNAYIKLSGFLALPIIVVAMIMACKEYLKANEGFATLGELFKASWLSYLIMGLITTIFGLILVKYISPEIAEVTKEQAMEMMEKISGMMGEEAAEEEMEKLENGDPFSFGSLIVGLLFKYAFAAIPAVIIAAIMKKEKSPFA
jgi:hypothetical protein